MFFRRLLCLWIVISFIFTLIIPPQKLYAHTVLDLPTPGTMVSVSPNFEPALIKGLTVHQDNPFLFDFIVDPGQDNSSVIANSSSSVIASAAKQSLKDQADRMIKYFFAALTIPDRDIWVNLSPYEKDRMIPVSLGQTAMGRDLLAQDYMLKQLTASLIYPQKALGKTFWDRVYTKAKAMYGTTQIPVNTFNKVWIVPQKAGIYEHGQTAFIVNGHLKVMLEEDYLSMTKHNAIDTSVIARSEATKQSFNNVNALGSQIIRAIILPEIEKEVNEGKNFATLRQIFYAQVLAVWFKRNLKQALLNQVYANKGTVKGIDQNDTATNEAIYRQYLQAYKKGVFNFIKEDIDPVTQETLPRKYFSGGYGDSALLSIEPAQLSDTAMAAVSKDFDFAVLATMPVNPTRRKILDGLGAAALGGVAAALVGKKYFVESNTPENVVRPNILPPAENANAVGNLIPLLNTLTQDDRDDVQTAHAFYKIHSMGDTVFPALKDIVIHHKVSGKPLRWAAYLVARQAPSYEDARAFVDFIDADPSFSVVVVNEAVQGVLDRNRDRAMQSAKSNSTGHAQWWDSLPEETKYEIQQIVNAVSTEQPTDNAKKLRAKIMNPSASDGPAIKTLSLLYYTLAISYYRDMGRTAGDYIFDDVRYFSEAFDIWRNGAEPYFWSPDQFSTDVVRREYTPLATNPQWTVHQVLELLIGKAGKKIPEILSQEAEELFANDPAFKDLKDLLEQPVAKDDFKKHVEKGLTDLNNKFTKKLIDLKIHQGIILNKPQKDEAWETLKTNFLSWRQPRVNKIDLYEAALALNNEERNDFKDISRTIQTTAEIKYDPSTGSFSVEGKHSIVFKDAAMLVSKGIERKVLSGEDLIKYISKRRHVLPQGVLVYADNGNVTFLVPGRSSAGMQFSHTLTFSDIYGWVINGNHIYVAHRTREKNENVFEIDGIQITKKGAFVSRLPFSRLPPRVREGFRMTQEEIETDEDRAMTAPKVFKVVSQKMIRFGDAGTKNGFGYGSYDADTVLEYIEGFIRALDSKAGQEVRLRISEKLEQILISQGEVTDKYFELKDGIIFSFNKAEAKKLKQFLLKQRSFILDDKITQTTIGERALTSDNREMIELYDGKGGSLGKFDPNDVISGIDILSQQLNLGFIYILTNSMRDVMPAIAVAVGMANRSIYKHLDDHTPIAKTKHGVFYSRLSELRERIAAKIKKDAAMAAQGKTLKEIAEDDLNSARRNYEAVSDRLAELSWDMAVARSSPETMQVTSEDERNEAYLSQSVKENRRQVVESAKRVLAMGGSVSNDVLRIVGDSRQLFPEGPDKAMRGGIDLSQQDAALHIEKDANGGVKVNVDPALIARIQREGMPEVVPVIINMQPADIRALFGLS